MKVTSMVVEGCKPTGQFPNKSQSQRPKYQIVLCMIQVKNLVLGRQWQQASIHQIQKR